MLFTICCSSVHHEHLVMAAHKADKQSLAQSQPVCPCVASGVMQKVTARHISDASCGHPHEHTAPATCSITMSPSSSRTLETAHAKEQPPGPNSVSGWVRAKGSLSFPSTLGKHSAWSLGVCGGSCIKQPHEALVSPLTFDSRETPGMAPVP